LDDGRLTDGQGRTVDFRNCVIVMTSNLGSQVIQELHGEDNYARMKNAVLEIVQGHFRPEFINRLDELVVFHPLEKDQIRAIAQLQMRHLEKRLAERELTIEVDDSALDYLGNYGYDPVYGARPLKRAVQSLIENPLAKLILEGAFVAGEKIRVTAEGGRMRFEKG
ncbi:MAG: AAA family ATPase, partial [Xanthomonadales bacterium]|nr:AAA family ATPase [Xanthomonadales bacterium]